MNFKALVLLITLTLASLTVLTCVSSSMYKAVDRNYKFIYRTENRFRGSVEYYVVEVVEITAGVERLLRLKITYDNGSFKTSITETVPESALSLYVPVLSDYDVTRLLSEGRSTLTFPLRVSDWNNPINETQPYAYKTITLKPKDYDTSINLTEGVVVRAILCSGFDNPYSLLIYIDQAYGLLLKLIGIDIRTGDESVIVSLEYSDLIRSTDKQQSSSRPRLEERLARYVIVIVIAAIVAVVVYVFSRID